MKILVQGGRFIAKWYFMTLKSCMGICISNHLVLYIQKYITTFGPHVNKKE